MKQFQAVYHDRDSFRRSLAEWKAWRDENASGQALIHIFSDGADDADVSSARKIVEEMMPDAAYELPYEGAKEMLLVDDIDNREFLERLLTAMLEELPAPGKKK